MTEDWGGAQWVLATLLAVRWTIGPAVRAAVGGDVVDAWVRSKPKPAYPVRWVGLVLCDIAMIVLLGWGGFW